jgi:hypothetical protein
MSIALNSELFPPSTSDVSLNIFPFIVISSTFWLDAGNYSFPSFMARSSSWKNNLNASKSF